MHFSQLRFHPHILLTAFVFSAVSPHGSVRAAVRISAEPSGGIPGRDLR
uniref:Uncharacterized protein n=1 Tax=Anguilla anguilla TaxID=7936 RepID=A0A0E9TPH9_ANGAN